MMNININWLLTGEGEMFQGLPSDELAEKEQALINHYRQMSSDVQRAVEVSFQAILTLK